MEKGDDARSCKKENESDYLARQSVEKKIKNSFKRCSKKIIYNAVVSEENNLSVLGSEIFSA